MACDTIAESVEVWKPHAASGGIYSVSSLGRVRREVRGRTRPAGGILVPALSAVGYDRVCVIYGGRQRCESVHRLVALAFIPNPHNHPQVNHKNGMKRDNRLSNLEWVTSSENTLHGFRELGRVSPCGEEKGTAKINSTQARVVIACKHLGVDRGWITFLASCWGVSPAGLGDIAAGRNWKHLPRPTPSGAANA